MALRKVTIVSGTTSYAAYSDTEALFIECIGGGAGGGGTSGGTGIAGGGGAGAYSNEVIPSGSVIPGPYAVQVGDGGAGGWGNPRTRDQNTGSVGQDTWFDSASFCLAKGGSGGQGGAAPKGGAGGVAADGVGEVKLDGTVGGRGFKYLDETTHKRKISGDGADGFFGAGGPGVSTKLPNQPLARDASLFGAGGSGAVLGRGGAGSAGLIRIWEYSEPVVVELVVSGAGLFWSPTPGTTEDVWELIHAFDQEFLGTGSTLETGPPRIDVINGRLRTSQTGNAIGWSFDTGSDWEHTIFVAVKPYEGVADTGISVLGQVSGSVGIRLNYSASTFDYFVTSSTGGEPSGGMQLTASYGEWQTIAYTVGPDGEAKQKAYKNGVLVSTVSKSFNITMPEISTNFSLGSLLEAPSPSVFSGSFSYHGWWPRELSEEEILSVHTYVSASMEGFLP
jgi:hypothetical protein